MDTPILSYFKKTSIWWFNGDSPGIRWSCWVLMKSMSAKLLNITPIKCGWYIMIHIICSSQTLQKPTNVTNWAPPCMKHGWYHVQNQLTVCCVPHRLFLKKDKKTCGHYCLHDYWTYYKLLCLFERPIQPMHNLMEHDGWLQQCTCFVNKNTNRPVVDEFPKTSRAKQLIKSNKFPNGGFKRS